MSSPRLDITYFSVLLHSNGSGNNKILLEDELFITPTDQLTTADMTTLRSTCIHPCLSPLSKMLSNLILNAAASRFLC